MGKYLVLVEKNNLVSFMEKAAKLVERSMDAKIDILPVNGCSVTKGNLEVLRLTPSAVLENGGMELHTGGETTYILNAANTRKAVEKMKEMMAKENYDLVLNGLDKDPSGRAHFDYLIRESGCTLETALIDYRDFEEGPLSSALRSAIEDGMERER